VMAVIITIMALELRAPHGATLDAVREQLPGLLVYVLSFTMVGIYWNNHHHLLRAADRISGAAMWGEPVPAVLALAHPGADRMAPGRVPPPAPSGRVRHGGARRGVRVLAP